MQGCYDDAVASLREKAIELEMANRNNRILLQNLALAEKRAVYDNLTGLFTRYEMEVQIKYHFSLLARAEYLLKNDKIANIDAEYFSILFVDLNDFKTINDACGHQY
ncbi:MAG: diguanylate cyclase, partial [Minisyncoccia bacterium]